MARMQTLPLPSSSADITRAMFGQPKLPGKCGNVTVHVLISFRFKIFSALLAVSLFDRLLAENSIYRVSVICKLTMECYVMSMCTS